nr:sodium/proton-translocating pyrophosphatase [Anaerolineae bacterium]
MVRLGVILTLLIPLLATAPAALAAPVAQEAREPLPWLWWLTPLGSIVALIFAYLLYQSVMQRKEGDKVMIEIAQAVREGAMAYLNRQYRIVGIVFAILFVILLIMSLANLQSIIVPFAFITGGLFSAICGFIGMKTATNASARTAHAART